MISSSILRQHIQHILLRYSRSIKSWSSAGTSMIVIIFLHTRGKQSSHTPPMNIGCEMLETFFDVQHMHSFFKCDACVYPLNRLLLECGKVFLNTG